eukprot:10669853-Prorocentrum_lima.AAC.1
MWGGRSGDGVTALSGAAVSMLLAWCGPSMWDGCSGDGVSFGVLRAGHKRPPHYDAGVGKLE